MSQNGIGAGHTHEAATVNLADLPIDLLLDLQDFVLFLVLVQVTDEEGID
jgi:hypothetical protein